MQYYDARDPAFESNGEGPSYDLDKLHTVPDSGFRQLQVKTQIALIPSQSAKTQASYLVARTNIVQSELA